MDLVIYRENTEGFYSDRNMYQGVGEMGLTQTWRCEKFLDVAV